LFQLKNNDIKIKILASDSFFNGWKERNKSKIKALPKAGVKTLNKFLKIAIDTSLIPE